MFCGFREGSRVNLCSVGFERAVDPVDRDICGSK